MRKTPNWSVEGFERIKEAAKRGNETQKRQHIERYLKEPKKCLLCGLLIPYDKKNNKFCDSSCAAIFNNALKIRKKQTYKQCLFCGKDIEKKGNIYCNKDCHNNKKKEETRKRFNRGDVSEPGTIRKILRDVEILQCYVCGLQKWNGEPIPLEIHHLNGDSEKNTPDNVKLICPNCHAQTDTYKTKNVGNGRHSRKIRYREGKSY